MTTTVRKATATLSVVLLLAMSVGLVNPAFAGLVPSPLLDPAQSVNEAKEQRLKPAYDALRSGNAVQAEASFREILRKDANDPAALLGMAAVEQSRGNAEAALSWMGRALTANPDDPALLHANARLLLEQNQPGEAVQSLQHAVRVDPDAFEPRRELAALLMQLGRSAEAVPHYRKLHDLKPSDPKTAAELGVALVAAGQFADGAALLEQSLPGVPGDLTALNALGHAQLRLGNAAKALTLFDQLLAANKAYPPAWLARGDALMELDRFNEATEAYLKAERLSRTPLAAFKRGVAQEKLGRRAEAETAYKAALKLDPDYGPAYNNLAFMLAAQPSRRDDALNWAKKAVAANERIASYHDTLGWVRQQRGEIDLARAAYGQALFLDARHDAARRHLRALDASGGASVAPAQPAVVASATDRATFTTDVPQPPPLPPAVPEAPPSAQTPVVTQAAVPASVRTGDASSTGKALDPRAALGQRLEAWRGAWQEKRVDDYLAMYGARFVPPSGMNRAAWESDRHRKLGKKGAIEVQLRELEFSVDGDKATTRFRQRYQSSNYSDETRKTLGWALESGVWKILAEDATPIK